MSAISRKPSTAERAVGLAVLGMLAVVAAGVLGTHFNFNPAVTALRPPGEAAGGAPAGASRPVETLMALPEGWTAAGPLERFSPATLSDKINGKAELYLSAGFRGLECQRLQPTAAAEFWLEIFVYDMGSAENAYAVFSSQRRRDAQPSPVAPQAYGTANGLYWVDGKRYVEAIASEASPRAARALETLAYRHTGNTPGKKAVEKDRQPEGPRWFPADGRVAGSERLIPDNAFGFDRFDRVYTAEFGSGDDRTTAFYSQRETAEEARELAAAYREFLVMFDALPPQPPLEIPDGWALEIMDAIEVVFVRGRLLAGVHGAPDARRAGELAGRLHRHIAEARDANQ